MPKKRKKTTGGNTSGKPGVTTKFLSDNFSSLPGTENFLNGHVLFLFITCSRKRGLTVKKLLSLIIPPVPQNQVVTVRERLAAGVKRVVSQTLDKYKNLSNANQLQVFDDICRKKFSFDVHASPSASASKPGTSKVPCAKSPEKPKPKSPKKTRQTEKCKSCRNYRTTLKNMELKYKQKQLGAKNMTANKKKKNAVKVLNQTIKRRDAKIQQLKETFEASTVGQDLLNTKLALSSVEKKHKKLKRANKIKKAGLTKRLSEEFEQTKSALKSQLAEKDEEICSLQHENLVLEEQVRGLQAQSKEVKADGKSFSSNMRMMVFDAVINQVPTNNIPKMLESFQLVVDSTFQMCHIAPLWSPWPGNLVPFPSCRQLKLYLQTKTAPLDLMPPHKRVCTLIVYMLLQKPIAIQLQWMSFLVALLQITIFISVTLLTILPLHIAISTMKTTPKQEKRSSAILPTV